MPSEPDVLTDITFALTASPEPISDGEETPCAYCNPTDIVEERRHSIVQENKSVSDVDDLPEDAGLVLADYALRFGHEDGTGVEVPVCDMCMIDFPIEFDGQTTCSELDYLYYGDGEIRKRVVESDGSQTIVRKEPVHKSDSSHD